MKKHLSVLGLWARLYGGQAAFLMALLAVCETALFAWRLCRMGTPPAEVGELLRGVPLIAGAALGALMTGMSDSLAGSTLTLRRLSIREEAAVLWKAVFNLLCLLALWAWQLAVVLALCGWYAASLPPEYRSGQTVFLAFYRVDFLHNLLPLDHWTRYLRNVVLLASLAFASAVRSYKARRDSRFGWGFALFLGGMVWVSFTAGIDGPGVDILVSLVGVCAVIVDGGYLLRGWEGKLDET